MNLVQVSDGLALFKDEGFRVLWKFRYGGQKVDAFGGCYWSCKSHISLATANMKVKLLVYMNEGVICCHELALLFLLN